MSRYLLPMLATLALAGTGQVHAETVPSSAACGPDAVVQARKLLAFHLGSDEPGMRVEETVKPLPSIVNPVDRKQRFDVLEVWGFFYKGEYRMRLEYYRSGAGCTLMGQEILEMARL